MMSTAQLLAQRVAAEHLENLEVDQQYSKYPSPSAASDDDDDACNGDACKGDSNREEEQEDDEDDHRSVVSDLSTASSANISSHSHISNVSNISNISSSHRAYSTANLSQQSRCSSSRSGGNLSGSKRPSSDSLSVTGHFQRAALLTGGSGSTLGSASGSNDRSHPQQYLHPTGASLGTGLSRTMSSKRSRGSLRSFRSNLGMVGENSTAIHHASANPNSNADWNFHGSSSMSFYNNNHNSNHKEESPNAAASQLYRHLGSLNPTLSMQDVLLRSQQQLSARTMSGLAPSSSSSRSTSSNGNFHGNANYNNLSVNDLASAVAGRKSSMASIASMASRTSVASMTSLSSMNSVGPSTAPKPSNPFLGGGTTSAAANFLQLMEPTAPAAASAHAADVAGSSKAAAATTTPTPATMSAPASSTAARPIPAPPASASSASVPHHQLSSATQDFLSLLQQPAGIHSVQALIQSQSRQLKDCPAPAPAPAKSPVAAAAAQSQPSGGTTLRKIPSIIGTCRGSTSSSASRKHQTTRDRGIKVLDDGTTVVVNGQTASAAHATNDSTDGDAAGEDEVEVSPQQLLMTTIQARGGDVTIRPVLSIDDKFHVHTDEEIAAYPPTAMLVRNYDLAGLQMAHRSGTRLQTANKFGESLLHIACRRGYDDVARYLLDEAGVTAWVRDDYGRTPCHDACWTAKPNLELMDLLVKRCPEMLLMSDKRGSTPLDYVRRDNWDVWRKFLEDRWDIISPKKS